MSLISIAVGGLRFVNLFFRPLKLKNKVAIISRQSDTPTLDIRLLTERLEREHIPTVVLTKTMKKSVGGAISYGVHLLQQMKALATCRVVVIDGYCITVSVLPHKEGQQVIQMWHALGAIKKFGWQSADRPDGHSREVSEAMCMHRGYDYVLSPSAVTGKFFAEAFRQPESKLVAMGLPRIDFLRAKDEEKRAAMEADYPAITARPSVLYVPTFRKHAALELERLIENFDFSRFNLIIKQHFLDKGDYSWAREAGAIVDEKYSSMEWLRVAEKVVTDYSAIAFEAAILDRELYIYQPDVTDYSENVGLNVFLEQEAIGAYVCRSEKELADKLGEDYDLAAVRAFREKYVAVPLDDCTGQLCGFIAGLLAE